MVSSSSQVKLEPCAEGQALCALMMSRRSPKLYRNAGEVDRDEDEEEEEVPGSLMLILPKAARFLVRLSRRSMFPDEEDDEDGS